MRAGKNIERKDAKTQRRKVFSLRLGIYATLCFILASLILSACAGNSPTEIPALAIELSPTPTSNLPKTLPIADSPLKDAIIRAGDYLARQQLPNGELSYQVDFMTGERGYSPSHLRLMGGTGALYTVCRVSENSKYCEAGDLALNYYLRMLVKDESKFKGTCFYAEGYCPLGGAALTIDTIHKRWQATGNVFLDGQDLSRTAVELGYFIISMRKPEGGFYHAYDPYAGGMVVSDYFMSYFPGESLLALLELYEMTGNDFWLEQAREVNAFMLTQPVTEDHWHAYAFSKMAQLDLLSSSDLSYAEKIADVMILGGVRSLNPKNTSVSTASKIEGLSALAQAFKLSDKKTDRFDAEIPLYVTFVHARQLPANDCGWEISAQVEKTFGGGIFSSCDDSSIRVDALQNWVNGVTAYLEYLGMGE